MKHKNQKGETSRITFRIPQYVVRQAREMAVKDRRSLNAQLVILVERGLTA